MAEATTRKTTIEGAGGHRLAAIVERPEEPRGGVLLSHCFTCNKHYKILVRLSRALSAAGFATLRFDYAGLGESEGDFEHTTLASDRDDLRKAVRWMLEEGLGPVALVGHSMGGVVSILAAEGDPEVRGVAVIASSSNTRNIYRLLPSLAPGARPGQGPVKVTIAGREYPIGSDFLESLENFELAESAAALRRPFLVLHGSEDSTVGIEHGERLFAAASQPKAFFALPGADHLLTRQRDTDLAGRILVDWVEMAID